MLYPQIDGEPDRLLQPVGGEPRQMQVGKAAAVQPFLDAGDALVVDIDVADKMRDLVAVGIDALVLGQEADAGQAEPIIFGPLLGSDFALEPGEIRFEASRSRSSTASRSGSTPPSSSLASSTSMIRRGSVNSDGVNTSVAKILPLRSRMSGRAVATASLSRFGAPCGPPASPRT